MFDKCAAFVGRATASKSWYGSKMGVQDGATCHTSKRTKEFLRVSGVERIEDWPPNSPNLEAKVMVWGWRRV